LLYDPITKTYFSLVNPVISPNHPSQRNILSLSYTEDLVNFSEWNIAVDRLLYDDTGLSTEDSFHYTGFLMLIGNLIDYHHLKINRVVLNGIVIAVLI
jgi:hypothetical protein